jgi:hypothetical protein
MNDGMPREKNSRQNRDREGERDREKEENRKGENEFIKQEK